MEELFLEVARLDRVRDRGAEALPKALSEPVHADLDVRDADSELRRDLGVGPRLIPEEAGFDSLAAMGRRWRRPWPEAA